MITVAFSAPPSKVHSRKISHAKSWRADHKGQGESPLGDRVGTEATDVKSLAGAMHMGGSQ